MLTSTKNSQKVQIKHLEKSGKKADTDVPTIYQAETMTLAS